MKIDRHRARWVLIAPGRWKENAVLTMAGGRLVAIETARPGKGVIDHGEGVLMPPLGNAHTHLSLSALRGKVETRQGFLPWVCSLIREREALPPQKIQQEAVSAACEMKRRGTGCAAEVGPLEPGKSALETNRISGAVFMEVLGFQAAPPCLPPGTASLNIYPAGHGLHTTPPETLVRLKGAGARFSLHLAESPLETQFLAQGKGPWADLMAQRGHDLSKWEPWGERPVARALRLGLLGPATLAVHLLEVRPQERDILVTTGTRVCFCPRSNWALHRKLPPIEAFLKAGSRPALGTDSLASVETLDMFDEMAFTAAHYPGLSPETILAMATVNAAEAVGCPGLGRLQPGRTGGMIHVALEANRPEAAAAALVAGRPEKVTWL